MWRFGMIFVKALGGWGMLFAALSVSAGEPLESLSSPSSEPIADCADELRRRLNGGGGTPPTHEEVQRAYPELESPLSLFAWSEGKSSPYARGLRSEEAHGGRVDLEISFPGNYRLLPPLAVKTDRDYVGQIACHIETERGEDPSLARAFDLSLRLMSLHLAANKAYKATLVTRKTNESPRLYYLPLAPELAAHRLQNVIKLLSPSDVVPSQMLEAFPDFADRVHGFQWANIVEPGGPDPLVVGRKIYAPGFIVLTYSKGQLNFYFSRGQKTKERVSQAAEGLISTEEKLGMDLPSDFPVHVLLKFRSVQPTVKSHNDALVEFFTRWEALFNN
jgi:hypothetical protein